MVVFSLQTFINTFFYVQSNGRTRRAAPAGQPKRMTSAERRKRTATPPHGWRGGRRGCPPVMATNCYRTAKKADIRGVLRTLDVRTHDNLVR
jgi:hypothetical protein